MVDKNRIAGSVKQVEGSVEETIGKLLGDTKLTAEGKTKQVAGKIQNTLGSLSDSLLKDKK